MTSPADTVVGGNNRLISLDLLRLLAVAMVLGRHLEVPPGDWIPTLRPAVMFWNTGGALGVDLFFVLSGFLVSGLLFSEFKKHGEISLSRFYVRRAWRIYPAFYTLVIITYFFSWWLTGWKMHDRQLFSELFFLQNYQQGYWNHTWTLALEEHFYILLPLALLAMVRRNPKSANPFRAVPYGVAAIVLLIPVVRTVNFAVRSDYSYHTHAWATHLRIDALVFGVGLAYAYHFYERQFRKLMTPLRHGMIALGIAIFTMSLWLPFSLSSFGIHTIGFTINYLGAAALFVGVMLCRIPDNGLTRAMAYLGSHSYSIYLWHMALMYWAMPSLKASLPWEARTLIYLSGAFAIGIGMAHLIEAPVLRVRDRWYPSRTAPAHSAPEVTLRVAA